MPKTQVPMQAVLPDRLRTNFDHDFGRQPQMMKLFVKLFGPYPLSNGYTVVVTDDDLEIPLEAQGISIFGANHCDGKRDSERLIAHELAHQWFGNSVTARRWRDIWLHEGFACYAEWLWSEDSGGQTADELAAPLPRQAGRRAARSAAGRPGPRDMFDDRVYKRGALTLHVLRKTIGDDKFFALLQDWTSRYKHGTVVTDDFTGLAANHADVSLRPLVGRLAVLDRGSAAVTDAGASFEALSATGADRIGGAGAITRGSVARVGAATAISAVCGYAVLYLAARDLNPAGFSVFGVFWGAFGLVNGAAYGLLQEATREVRSANYVEIADGPRTHPMRVAIGVGLVAAVVVAGTSPLWAPHVFSDSRPLSVGLLSVGLAGILHARHASGHARRYRTLGWLRRADGHRRRHAGGGRRGDVRHRMGPGRIPVGHRRRRGGLAADAGGLAGCPHGGPAVHTRRYRNIPARRRALDRRGRCQRGPGHGLPGAAQGRPPAVTSARRVAW